jgi:hypothetical protein
MQRDRNVAATLRGRLLYDRWVSFKPLWVVTVITLAEQVLQAGRGAVWDVKESVFVI